MAFRVGPRTQRQMRQLARDWKQGEHLIISGDTGSGKTTLGRLIDQIRINAGGNVVLFVAKLAPDQTILDDYKGWTRWTHWKTNPRPDEKKILLWPDLTQERGTDAKRAKQKAVFKEAIDALADIGHWTVDFDEGLYMCSPDFMNMASDIAMLHALGRSSKLTVITKMQRPSNVPLIIFGSASNAFIGRVRTETDLKRLSEMGGRETVKDLQRRLSTLGRRDFLWVPIAEDQPPQLVNVSR